MYRNTWVGSDDFTDNSLPEILEYIDRKNVQELHESLTKWLL